MMNFKLIGFIATVSNDTEQHNCKDNTILDQITVAICIYFNFVLVVNVLPTFAFFWDVKQTEKDQKFMLNLEHGPKQTFKTTQTPFTALHAYRSTSALDYHSKKPLLRLEVFCFARKICRSGDLSIKVKRFENCNVFHSPKMATAQNCKASNHDRKIKTKKLCRFFKVAAEIAVTAW